MTHRTGTQLTAILLALTCAFAARATVTFFVEPTGPGKALDAKADLAFQTALQMPFAEFDFQEFGSDHLRSPSPLFAGSNRVRPCAVDGDGKPAVKAAQQGARLVETFAARPGGIPEKSGAAEGTFLLNRTRDAAGKEIVGRGIEFTFDRPVRGFGTWIVEDFPEANGFVLRVTEVGGETSTSRLLESGNGANLAIEGFVGAVSSTGIEKVVVEQRTLDGKPSAADFFYLDHVQVSRAPQDTNPPPTQETTQWDRNEKIGERCFDLIHDHTSVATLVLPDERAEIWTEAAKMIAQTVSRWGGGELTIVRKQKNQPLPAGNVILLGTPETSAIIAALGQQTESVVSRISTADDQSFAMETRASSGGRQLILAGKRPRGAFNAAVYCRDFLLEATAGDSGKADVFVREASIFRSPRLAVRGTYTLSFYGRAVEYTAEDWMRMVDRFAEDGMSRMNFWLSGHHPSKKFPHLYNVDDPAGQSTKGTKLTVEGVTKLIRHCHERGIEFFIGGGAFAWCALEQLAQGHPEIKAVGSVIGGLCPSKPYARAATREHFLEMYDTWPEADGFMFEVRDEYGECHCAECQVKLDEFGSKQYGRSEITWLQEFAREAWKKNPALRFCWLIGYGEHTRDVEYYEQIRRMNDPRFEWLDTRVGLPGPAAGALPGLGAIPRPFTFFSQRIEHWDQFYTLPIQGILSSALRTTEHGLNGYIAAFEPGPWVGSSSYYGDVIPLPVDILRTASWVWRIGRRRGIPASTSPISAALFAAGIFRPTLPSALPKTCCPRTSSR